MSSGAPGHRIIVLTAPSGAGKTTIARRVLQARPDLRFSVSVTTRPPRPNEKEGVDYYFVSEARFREHLAAGDLLEYEEVYPGRFYGTLRSEVERLAESGPVLLDVDVKGALSVKKIYGARALALFICPPSPDVLAERLRRRATESGAALEERLARAEMELGLADRFDAVIVNEDLEQAVAETLRCIRSFLDA